MKVLVVGLGNQGQKRIKLLKKNELAFTVDNKKIADYRNIKDVPKREYDTVFICVPEKEKLKIINFCIKNSKNILVEKPLSIVNHKNFIRIERELKKKNIILYTAYNLRFEPSIIMLKRYIDRKFFGKIYYCRMFYGNGTAINVRLKKWRDRGNGVLSDLGSHLLDLSIFLFNYKKLKKVDIFKNRFENTAPDFSILRAKTKSFNLELVSSFCSWKNTFNIEIVGKKGSAKIDSLSKWGKSTLKIYKRRFPSGLPRKKIINFNKGDSTFNSEQFFFSKLIKKNKVNLNRDKLINKYILNFK